MPKPSEPKGPHWSATVVGASTAMSGGALGSLIRERGERRGPGERQRSILRAFQRQHSGPVRVIESHQPDVMRMPLFERARAMHGRATPKALLSAAYAKATSPKARGNFFVQRRGSITDIANISRKGRKVSPYVMSYELGGQLSRTQVLRRFAPWAVGLEFANHEALGDALPGVVGATLVATKTVPEVEKAIRGYRLLQSAFPSGGHSMHRAARNLYMMNNLRPLVTSVAAPLVGAAAAYAFTKYKKSKSVSDDSHE